ncbi:hypothetical protein ACFLYQ_00390 [Chloroflexota bacterium]
MTENKYDKLFLTEPELRNKPMVEMKHPAAYIDSALHFGASTDFSMAWRYITEPMLLDEVPHAHDFNQYLCFFGGNLENMFDFDATIELSLGKEQKKHLIEKATVVFIPKGMHHCPLNFKRIDKPVLFHPIALTPAYYSQFAESRRRI